VCVCFGGVVGVVVVVVYTADIGVVDGVFGVGCDIAVCVCGSVCWQL